VAAIHVPPPEEFAELDQIESDRWSNFVRRQEPHFAGLLGLRIDTLRVGWCRMRMPFRPELTQPAGMVHGGAIAALVDTSLVPAVGTSYRPGTAYATIGLQVQYLGAASDGDDLVAVGWVTRTGRAVAFGRAEVATASGQPVASGSLTFRIGPAGPRAA
jgi:uncharacterized protein (TIGR00369 family)